jgi:hypothetical protein
MLKKKILIHQAKYHIAVTVKKLINSFDFSNLKVLDYGCGAKPYAHLFINKQCQYNGYDLIEFRDDNLLKIKYDLIFITFVLYQNQNLGSDILNNLISNNLRPQGRILFIEPRNWISPGYQQFDDFSCNFFLKRTNIEVINHYYLISNYSLLLILFMHFIDQKVIHSKYRFILKIFKHVLFSFLNCIIYLDSKIIKKNSPPPPHISLARGFFCKKII